MTFDDYDYVFIIRYVKPPRKVIKEKINSRLEKQIPLHTWKHIPEMSVID